MCKDISEIIEFDSLSELNSPYEGKNIAFQSPCTLQHGLGVTGKVESLLDKMGMNILSVQNSHLCYGAAGTYSILQKELSNTLKSNKLRELQRGNPDIVATANIGCLLHLSASCKVPVKHWVELLVEQ